MTSDVRPTHRVQRSNGRLVDGRELIVTLHHPHGQIYAYPFVAPRTATMLRRARQHTGSGDLVGDLLDADLVEGTRVVTRSPHWTALVPAAARWPIEVRVVPHRHVADLAALDEAERSELARVYLDVLRRIEAFFPGVATVPYIAACTSPPSTRTEISCACISKCSRSCGPPASSSTWPDPSPPWARGSTMSRQSMSPPGFGK